MFQRVIYRRHKDLRYIVDELSSNIKTRIVHKTY